MYSAACCYSFLPGLLLGQRLRETQWEKGTLEKNQKTGVWEYYGYLRDGTRVVLQKYDHTSHISCWSSGPSTTCPTAWS